MRGANEYLLILARGSVIDNHNYEDPGREMKLYCTKCQKMKCLIGELVCDDCKNEIVYCAYCGRMSNEKFAQRVTIWVNRGQREMWFCEGGACASYYQMGAEG